MIIVSQFHFSYVSGFTHQFPNMNNEESKVHSII